MVRTDPDLVGDERAILTGFIRYHRETLRMKCEGLDAEQLARRAIPPSSLSLLGLVRHVASVERAWLRGFAGEEFEPLYYTDDEPDLDFDGAVADEAVVAQAFADFEAETAYVDAIVTRSNLDDVYHRHRDGRSETFSLRWILAHLIEEYARHNGHADLLREVIDGVTGE